MTSGAHMNVQLREAELALAALAADASTMLKGPTYIGGFLGSLVGSVVPSIWGAGQLSLASMAFFMLGGFFGIWLAYRLSA